MPTELGTEPPADLLLDTSSAVALILEDHARHRAVLEPVRGRRLGLAGRHSDRPEPPPTTRRRLERGRSERRRSAGGAPDPTGPSPRAADTLQLAAASVAAESGPACLEFATFDARLAAADELEGFAHLGERF